MKRLLTHLFVLPFALAGCVVTPPYGPGPRPAPPPPPVSSSIMFAPAVRPYIYNVTQVSIYVFSVRYLPSRVTPAQILAGFGNRCAALGRQPVAGQIRVVSGKTAGGGPVNNRVMTVYCR